MAGFPGCRLWQIRLHSRLRLQMPAAPFHHPQPAQVRLQRLIPLMHSHFDHPRQDVSGGNHSRPIRSRSQGMNFWSPEVEPRTAKRGPALRTRASEELQRRAVRLTIMPFDVLRHQFNASIFVGHAKWVDQGPWRIRHPSIAPRRTSGPGISGSPAGNLPNPLPWAIVRMVGNPRHGMSCAGRTESN